LNKTEYLRTGQKQKYGYIPPEALAAKLAEENKTDEQRQAEADAEEEEKRKSKNKSAAGGIFGGLFGAVGGGDDSGGKKKKSSKEGVGGDGPGGDQDEEKKQKAKKMALREQSTLALPTKIPKNLHVDIADMLLKEFGPSTMKKLTLLEYFSPTVYIEPFPIVPRISIRKDLFELVAVLVVGVVIDCAMLEPFGFRL
jgi:hypothetical protein